MELERLSATVQLDQWRHLLMVLVMHIHCESRPDASGAHVAVRSRPREYGQEVLRSRRNSVCVQYNVVAVEIEAPVSDVP